MADAPISLAELQARFQDAIVNGDDAVLSLIPANSRTSNAVLFGVYRFAYAARLVEVVRAAYPILARHIGDEPFEAMARRYIALYPSRHSNARWYAIDVPEMLTGDVYAPQPELAEIARLESTLDRAFDAEDAPVIDLAALAQFSPDRWAGLAFRPHPSAAVLSASTNAFEIWRALKNHGEAPDVVLLDEAEHLLVWRREAVPTVRRLEPEERMLWVEASRGVPFGALCEMGATFDDPETAALRVAQHLHGWLSTGLLTEVVT